MPDRASALKVTTVMTGDVEFIAADALVQQAAEMMGELDVGALPVGTAEKVEGVVTDRDILYRLVARGIDPSAATVRDVMTTPVIGCDVDDTLANVMDAMAAHHIRRMPVRDAAGRVAGWITLADVSRKLLIDSQALQGFMTELTEG